jgi:hypothetical protein
MLELLEYLTPSERAEWDALVAMEPSVEGDEAPQDWPAWLGTITPQAVAAGYADRHRQFWAWVWAIEPGHKPDPFVAVWPRGGGKSTSAELAVTALGARAKRKYVLYVRGTQEKADDSVSNIGRRLEHPVFARYYPSHAERDVGKFGNARGWRRNRLSTAGGFTVDAIGLDSIARGAKIDDARPDLIIFDDIDEKHDTAATTAKKIATITTSILPAGSTDCAVLAIQNLIIPDGFFTRMVDGRADYLADRQVSGPFPAVDGLEVDYEMAPSGIRKPVIVAGTATWAGQDLQTCQKQIREWGLGAFRKEAQHEVTDRSQGLALRVVEVEHLNDQSDVETIAYVRQGRVFAGIDFGAWRFACVVRVLCPDQVVREVFSYFSQGEGLGVRADALVRLCTHYGTKPNLRFRGDAANPQDILELNAHFRRLGSRMRVLPVAMENKGRSASVNRLNDLLDRRILRYRRDSQDAVSAILGLPRVWRLGMNAASEGVEMSGSRLWWEVTHWSYPVPKEGEAQKQDPDDHTADGSDCIAADRYGIMSWLRPVEQPADETEYTSSDPDIVKAEAERHARVTWKPRKDHKGRPLTPVLDPSFGAY